MSLLEFSLYWIVIFGVVGLGWSQYELRQDFERDRASRAGRTAVEAELFHEQSNSENA